MLICQRLIIAHCKGEIRPSETRGVAKGYIAGAKRGSARGQRQKLASLSTHGAPAADSVIPRVRSSYRQGAQGSFHHYNQEALSRKQAATQGNGIFIIGRADRGILRGCRRRQQCNIICGDQEEPMSHWTDHTVPLHEQALRLALKEILAHATYNGVVPSSPDYATVIQRAAEIERTLTVEHR